MWRRRLRILAILCYLLCYANVEERVATPQKPKHERQSFGAMLGTLATNRALTGLITASLFMLIALMLLSGMMPYVLNEYFNNGQLLSAVNFVGLAPTLLLVPFASKLAKTFGKKEVGPRAWPWRCSRLCCCSPSAPTARTSSWPATRSSRPASPA